MNVEAGAVVRLGDSGIVLYGDRYRGPGTRGNYYFRDFDWTDMPGVRADDTPRPMGDGNFPAQSYLEAVDRTMVGFLVAPTHRHLVNASDRLKALRGQTLRVSVDEPGRTSWADAEIRGVQVDPLGFAPEAELRLVFHMPDPRKYGPSKKVFASGEMLSHWGNHASIPDVTVTGNMPSGYAIVGAGGKQYVVSQGLAPGQTHRIDFSTGWLYLNGVLQAGAVTRAETWTIPAGMAVGSMTLVPVSGSGALAIRVPYTAI